ncbi:hypothetical protein LPW41_11635 [Microbacterium sp. JC 701]|uniref:hypothetical protein n=1 Tax=Microbacterium sp. JC 701 TaxID=2897389 RepID=UPI001E2F9085|nr:hypothetical protein [Microbacterium sp. JC 701]MCD2170348.1 hypothetical protein [Microbacterium sp. JC 701]
MLDDEFIDRLGREHVDAGFVRNVDRIRSLSRGRAALDDGELSELGQLLRQMLVDWDSPVDDLAAREGITPVFTVRQILLNAHPSDAEIDRATHIPLETREQMKAHFAKGRDDLHDMWQGVAMLPRHHDPGLPAPLLRLSRKEWAENVIGIARGNDVTVADLIRYSQTMSGRNHLRAPKEKEKGIFGFESVARMLKDPMIHPPLMHLRWIGDITSQGLGKLQRSVAAGLAN